MRRIPYTKRVRKSDLSGLVEASERLEVLRGLTGEALERRNAAIVAAYEGGASWREISRAAGLTQRGVWLVLRKFGYFEEN